jgi:hypothetical protein
MSNYVTDVYAANNAVDDAFIDEGKASMEYARLIERVRAIVREAWRVAYEHGLATGSLNKDAFADDAFARGFIEGEKHALNAQRLAEEALRGVSKA